MRRLIPVVITLVTAAACGDSSGPPASRAQLNFVLQDPTYKPLLATQDTFWAKAQGGGEVRLFYQGSTAVDTGPEFLRFEVPSDGLYLKPDGSPFGPGDSIRITVTVVDSKKFQFDFQPAGLRFNPADPARLKIKYQYADHDFNGDGKVDSADNESETLLDRWRREPPDSLWFKVGA